MKKFFFLLLFTPLFISCSGKSVKPKSRTNSDPIVKEKPKAAPKKKEEPEVIPKKKKAVKAPKKQIKKVRAAKKKPILINGCNAEKARNSFLEGRGLELVKVTKTYCIARSKDLIYKINFCNPCIH